MEIIPPVFSYLFEYSWRDYEALEGTLSFVFPSTSPSTSGDILRMPPKKDVKKEERIVKTKERMILDDGKEEEAVSYTHLTLPTIYSV